jgi:hypothetical protein
LISKTYHAVYKFLAIKLPVLENAVFKNMMPCGVVDVYQHLRKAYSSALKMEAAHFSEMLVNIYQSTQQHTPEDAIFILTVMRA